MKALQIHNLYREPGGEEVIADHEAAALRAAGHQVVTYRAQNPSSSLAAARNLALSAWNPFAVRHIARLVEAERPDVVHAHNTWFSLSPAVLRTAGRHGATVVASLHNFRLLCVSANLFRDGAVCEDCVGTVPWRGVVHRCYQGSAAASLAVASTYTAHRLAGTWSSRVDRILVTSDFAKRYVVKAGVPADRIAVSPCPVDDPGPRTAAPETSDTVLYVGRLVAEKGLDRLVDLWRRTRPGLQLVVVGEGPLRSLEADAPDGVRFLGWQPRERVNELLLGARALAAPSLWYETQGMVVAEALAAGLPVVTGRVGAMSETAGRGALALVDAEVASWDAALDRLVDDDAVRSVGSAARQEFEQRLQPSAAAERLERIYAAAGADRASSA